jgi:RimJ/RimL family protein N-acetyltransferase
MKDINDFIDDERKEIKKEHAQRRYYSYIIIHDNHVIGFIAGRKSKPHTPRISPYDLLLRIFISSTEKGKGYGKEALHTFITTYKRIINSTFALISDISKTNIASIKIHLNNKFAFKGTVKAYCI